MSECGSTKTLNSSNGDSEEPSCSFVPGNEVVLADGNGKYRDGKRWKQRFLVLSKLSPAADCLQLQIYRDEKERARNGHTKASLSLQHFLAMESGFTLDKESHTLGIICQDLSVVLAFDNRERLIQWSVRINHNLGEGQQFLVQLSSVPPKSKLTPGPVKLHVSDKRFCLTGGIPPRLLGSWEMSNLRRYGVVDGRLIFEGGSRCGKGEGVHVLLPDPPQLHVISDALDLAAKGQLIRMPSRRFGNVTDSPRKSIVNRFCDTNISRQPTSMDSYPNMGMECAHGPSPWIEGSSRFDIDSCGDNLSVIAPSNMTTACGPGSPSKIGQPLPSAMERCLSCMSKLGQLGPLSGPDTLRPSWTMDLSLNPMLGGNECGGVNSDRISLSSHGSSSGGVTEYCYDTPRSMAVTEMKRNHHHNCNNIRSHTPPVHQACHGCDSPQRGVLAPRNHCTSPPPHNYQCNTSTSAASIYYNLPPEAHANHHHHHPQQQQQNQPQKSLQNVTGVSVGNGSKPPINLSQFAGPYENYDFPRPTHHTTINPVSQNCCNGTCSSSTSCNGSFTSSLSNANIDWSKKHPMDRSSIASSMMTTDSSVEWYDTPRRCGSELPNRQQSQQTSCSCCQHYSQPRSCNTQKVVPVQVQAQPSCTPAPAMIRDPLENYDFPPQKTTMVDPQRNSGAGFPPTVGVVNGEGKMPLVTASVPLKIPPAQNVQPLYAQVDKAKKTPRPLPSNCDIHNATPVVVPLQPLYVNAPDQHVKPTVITAIVHEEPKPVVEQNTLKSHSNYVNLEFAESLHLYESSKDIRSEPPAPAPTAAAISKVPMPEEASVTYENLKPEQKEKPNPQAPRSENSSSKSDNSGAPLRRSSSVPCKGGHANRGSASSSDSGVSGDGALYFDDSSPINELGSLCLHESLPRKNQRISPTSSGKELSAASTPKEVSTSLSAETKLLEDDSNYTEITEQTTPTVEEKPPSPRHYETIDEAETVTQINSRSTPSSGSAPYFRSSSSSSSTNGNGGTQLKNPLSLVSDANSTSSGASDMSDYLETLSSCSRGSSGEILSNLSTPKNPLTNINLAHHSQSYAQSSVNNSPINISVTSSPKKATNMKPRSGKEYFKIDRSQFK